MTITRTHPDTLGHHDAFESWIARNLKEIDKAAPPDRQLYEMLPALWDMFRRGGGR
jgi:hypothetical protein